MSGGHGKRERGRKRRGIESRSPEDTVAFRPGCRAAEQKHRHRLHQRRTDGQETADRRQEHPAHAGKHPSQAYQSEKGYGLQNAGGGDMGDTADGVKCLFLWFLHIFHSQPNNHENSRRTF